MKVFYFFLHFLSMFLWLWKTKKYPEKISRNKNNRKKNNSLYSKKCSKNTSECWSYQKGCSESSSHHTHIFCSSFRGRNIRNISLYYSKSCSSNSRDKTSCEIQGKSNSCNIILRMNRKKSHDISYNIDRSSKQENIFSSKSI